jgi:hypothetical protein
MGWVHDIRSCKDICKMPVQSWNMGWVSQAWALLLHIYHIYGNRTINSRFKPEVPLLKVGTCPKHYKPVLGFHAPGMVHWIVRWSPCTWEVEVSNCCSLSSLEHDTWLVDCSWLQWWRRVAHAMIFYSLIFSVQVWYRVVPSRLGGSLVHMSNLLRYGTATPGLRAHFHGILILEGIRGRRAERI